MEQIRAAVIEDAGVLLDIQSRTWIDSYQNLDHGIDTEDLRLIDWEAKLPSWQHMILSQEYGVYVFEKDSEITGYAVVIPENQGVVLDSLYVAPEHQRSGHGSQLLEYILEQHTSIALQVATYNHGAIRFYERYGFASTGLLGVHVLPRDKTIPTQQMRYRKYGRAHQWKETMHNGDKATAELVGRARLARESGERDSTIKWYSEIGLLPFHQEEERRRRRYDLSTSLRRLEEIHDFKRQGLHIEEIKSKLAPPKSL